MWVSGTATCSAPSGTATVDVHVRQMFMAANAAGSGSTTVARATQPAYWSGGLCLQLGTGSGRFLTNSFGDAYATLTGNGVDEAFHADGFPSWPHPIGTWARRPRATPESGKRIG